MNTNDTLKNKETGNLSFPVTVLDNYSSGVKPSKNFISSHYHCEFELFYLSHGNIIFTVGDVSHYLESGQLISIPPNTVHSVYSVHAHPFFYKIVKFNLDFLKGDGNFCDNHYYSDISNNSIPIEYVISADSEQGGIIISTFRKLNELLNKKPPAYEIGVKGYLELIIYNVIYRSSLSQPEYISENEFQPVFEYIESNYMRNIIIDTLASLSSMSKYYFIRQFHKATGQTPIEYVNSLRVKKACGMLMNDKEMRITDIAFSVGFNDLSYFNRVFKRITGTTPQKYKQQSQKQSAIMSEFYVKREEPLYPVPFYTFML